MPTVIACFVATLSTGAFLKLWFWVVRKELSAKLNTVKSAELQLLACRQQHMQAQNYPEKQRVQLVLDRSFDIYNQSISLYNQALKKLHNRIPGFLMGFYPMREGEVL